MSVGFGILLGIVIVVALNIGMAWWISRPLPEAKRAAERWAERTSEAAERATLRGPAI